MGTFSNFLFINSSKIFGVGAFSLIKAGPFDDPAFGTPDDGLFNFFSQSQSLSFKRRRDVDQVDFYLS